MRNCILSVICLATLFFGKTYAAQVTEIKQDGKTTVVKCSKGDEIRIYQSGNGQCKDNYSIGSYSCQNVIDSAKKRCQDR